MKTKPTLPLPFVKWLHYCFLQNRHVSVRRMHRAVILRWILWQDGNPTNAIPGYPTCPPESPYGFPSGWTYEAFRSIARDVLSAPVRTGLRTPTNRPSIA